MRRFAIVLAMYGACCCSWATAAPFDELSDRIDQFDRQQSRTPSVPKRNAPRRNANVSYRQNLPPNAAPQPMPAEEQWEEGEYQGDGSNGPMFDDGFDGGLAGGCDGGGCCGSCGPPGGFWGRAEYLAWWVRGSSTPPLVSTSPDNTPVGVAGVLPGATVLFGGQRVNTQGRSGGRFTLGYFLDNCSSISVEDTFLFLGNTSDSFNASSNGSPILARPFFNTSTNQQDAILLAYPQTVVGSVNVTATSQVLGNEINLRRPLFVDCCRRIDLLAGYRFFHVNEGLEVTTNTTSLGGAAPIGTTFGILDSFKTQNNFNGGQLGLNTTFSNDRWSLDLLVKVALGGVSQVVTIDGRTVVTVPNQPSTSSAGGILALNSNIGQYTRNRFAVLPEFGVNLHYQLSQLWIVNVGYTFMVLTNVVRPGDQIDTQLDPNQFPPGVPGTFPKFAFHDSDLIMQGINVGLECNF